jgi:type IV/VI secretion system ImpK/VasF family protein
MTLLELCEPLFLKICELNRMARSGQSQEFQEARAQLRELLDEIQQNATANGKMATQARKLEQPLTFFVDSMIATSKLKFAPEWQQNRLAKEKFNILTGDSDFPRMLKETLDDTSDDAAERLAVFYVCLGLGFMGALVVQPAKVKEYMDQISPRIKHLMDVETKARLCPDAYNYLDTRNLIPPPTNRLVFVLILFIFLCLATVVACVGMYVNATGDLGKALDTIMKQDKAR